MSIHTRWKTLEVIPTLDVGSLEEALSFYHALGFEKEWSYPSDESPDHVGLALGKVNLMLALCRDEPPKIERQNLYFVMNDLTGFHEHLRGEFGEKVPEIVDSDYGMRDFALRDPWGHLLTFGEAL